MNQKIVGIIPLIAAMMFVAVFAVGDNSVAAASTGAQTVTVTVNPNIAITVPSTLTMAAADGATAQSSSYIVNNTGNVQVYVYVSAANAAFTSASSVDTIPITGYQIKNQGGSYTTITQTLQKITTTKLNTLNHGTNTLTIDQKLAIPTGTEAATDYTNTVTYTAMTS
jgi:hypothetical protein